MNVLLYISQTSSTGITKKELTDVEILEQTASLLWICGLKQKTKAKNTYVADRGLPPPLVGRFLLYIS